MSKRTSRVPRLFSEFTVGRGVEVFILMLLASLLSLALFPPVLSIAIWIIGPPLLAVFFARPEPERNVVQMYGVAAGLGWALAAALWTAFFFNEAFFAVLVSVFVTGIVGAIVAVVVVLLVSLRFPKERRRSAATR